MGTGRGATGRSRCGSAPRGGPRGATCCNWRRGPATVRAARGPVRTTAGAWCSSRPWRPTRPTTPGAATRSTRAPTRAFADPGQRRDLRPALRPQRRTARAAYEQGPIRGTRASTLDLAYTPRGTCTASQTCSPGRGEWCRSATTSTGRCRCAGTSRRRGTPAPTWRSSAPTRVYWRVRFSGDGRLVTCYKSAALRPPARARRHDGPVAPGAAPRPGELPHRHALRGVPGRGRPRRPRPRLLPLRGHRSATQATGMPGSSAPRSTAPTRCAGTPANLQVVAHSPVAQCAEADTHSDMTYYHRPSGAGVFAVGHHGVGGRTPWGARPARASTARGHVRPGGDEQPVPGHGRGTHGPRRTLPGATSRHRRLLEHAHAARGAGRHLLRCRGGGTRRHCARRAKMGWGVSVPRPRVDRPCETSRPTPGLHRPRRRRARHPLAAGLPLVDGAAERRAVLGRAARRPHLDGAADRRPVDGRPGDRHRHRRRRLGRHGAVGAASSPSSRVFGAASGIAFHTVIVREWLIALYGTTKLVTRKALQLGHVLTRRTPTGEVLSVSGSDGDQFGALMEITTRAISQLAAYLVVAAIVLSTSVRMGAARARLGAAARAARHAAAATDAALAGRRALAQLRADLDGDRHRRRAAHPARHRRRGDVRRQLREPVPARAPVRRLGRALARRRRVGRRAALGRVRRRADVARHARGRPGPAHRRASSSASSATASSSSSRCAPSSSSPRSGPARSSRRARRSPCCRSVRRGCTRTSRPSLDTERRHRRRRVRGDHPPGHPHDGRLGRARRLRGARRPARPLPAQRGGGARQRRDPRGPQGPGRPARALRPGPAPARSRPAATRSAPAGRGASPSAGSTSSRVELDDVRRHILVSDTAPQVFAGTLRSAVDPLGRLSREQAERALHTAAADDVFDALPGGWQGELEERGRGLSGGQRQRLVLMRALAADPEVLVLVEPTSAVDAHTEARIAARLGEHRAGRTTVVMTASPLLLHHADEIILLESGVATARGRHADLLGGLGGIPLRRRARRRRRPVRPLAPRPRSPDEPRRQHGRDDRRRGPRPSDAAARAGSRLLPDELAAESARTWDAATQAPAVPTSCARRGPRRWASASRALRRRHLLRERRAQEFVADTMNARTGLPIADNRRVVALHRRAALRSERLLVVAVVARQRAGRDRRAARPAAARRARRLDGRRRPGGPRRRRPGRGQHGGARRRRARRRPERLHPRREDRPRRCSARASSPRAREYIVARDPAPAAVPRRERELRRPRHARHARRRHDERERALGAARGRSSRASPSC